MDKTGNLFFQGTLCLQGGVAEKRKTNGAPCWLSLGNKPVGDDPTLREACDAQWCCQSFVRVGPLRTRGVHGQHAVHLHVGVVSRHVVHDPSCLFQQPDDIASLDVHEVHPYVVVRARGQVEPPHVEHVPVAACGSCGCRRCM